MMRIILAHPTLAMCIDDAAIAAAKTLAPDGANMLLQLVEVAQSLGASAQFAPLADLLRSNNADFDELIKEVVSQTETDIELCQQELYGAIRNIKVQQIKSEQAQIAARGLKEENDKIRFYALKKQLDDLVQQNIADSARQ